MENISWMYETDDSADLKDVYDKLHSEAEDMLGESGIIHHAEHK